MKHLFPFVCVLLIIILCVQGVSASFAVANLAVNSKGKAIGPNDKVAAGTPISASATIEFDAEGGETFPSENTLLLATDLDNAVWTYNRILDGNPDPASTQKGKNVNIIGWMLSFPSRQELSMSVKVDGVAPSVNASGDQVVIRIADLNSRGNVVAGSEVVEKRFIVNPSEITGVVSAARNQLAAFRTAIDAQAATGINTDDAEAKYRDASTALDNADKANADSKFTDAQVYSSNADVLIKDGMALLDKATAQKSVGDAQNSLDATDEIITYFKVNRSMGSDPRVVSLISQRDSVADLISESNDFINQVKYANAKDTSSQAAVKAKQTFDSAVALRKEAGEGLPGMPALPGLPSVDTSGIGGMLSGALMYILAGVGVAILVVVGIILYRRRTGWDELG